MIWAGKIMAGALGTMLGGPLAGLFAAGLGHMLDREVAGYARAFRRQYAEAWREYWSEALFAAEFLLAGYLARSAALRVDEAEGGFEALVERRLLHHVERERARALFDEGQRADFPLTVVVNQVRREAHRRPDLLQELFTALLCFDGLERSTRVQRRARLLELARRFALTEADLVALERAAAEHRRRRQPARAKRSLDPVTAYSILGVAPDATEADVRRAYRTQMSRHHPDKLAHTRPSDERLAQAAHRTDRIRKAFETIRRTRGW